MTIRIPEKYYIKALMAGRMSAEQVLDDLAKLKIPAPPMELFKQLYDELKSSNEDFFNSPKTIVPSEDWLEDEGIAEMYALKFSRAVSNRIAKKILGCQGALNMILDPNLKKYNYTLALAGMEQADVELIINARYSIAHDSPDFNAFFHYFCNFEDWTYADKELYMESSPDGLKSIYRIALKNDRSYLIWKLQLGTDPNLKYEEMLKDMLTDSYFLFKENVRIKPDDANKFAVLATKLADRLDGLAQDKDKGDDLLSKLKFKLEISSTQDNTPNTDIKSIAQIQVEVPNKNEEIAIQSLEEMMNKP